MYYLIYQRENNNSHFRVFSGLLVTNLFVIIGLLVIVSIDLFGAPFVSYNFYQSHSNGKIHILSVNKYSGLRNERNGINNLSPETPPLIEVKYPTVLS